MAHPPIQHYVSPAPSPHPHPVLTMPLTVSFHVEEYHNHVLRLALIIIACIVGVITFLLAASVIKIFNSRRHSYNRNRRGSSILFDLNEDSTISDDIDHDDDEGQVMHHIWFIRTVGLQQSFIDSITVFKYAKDEGLIDGTECSVCLGEFQHGETLRLLPKCSHAFHIPCIDTWLTSHKNCPLCRAPVAHEHVITPPDQNNHNQTDENVSHNQEALTHINSDGSGRSESNVPRSEFEGGDASAVSSSGIHDKAEEETQILRRTVSVDSSSPPVILRHSVLNLNSDRESSDTHFGEKMDSSSKVASIGRALQKKPISMGRSFSHNRKILFSRHCRSYSSTLPL
ncbi:hypothetical protein VNO77_00961 [Canavalia gladiata]|uniref:RING-type E3 ubiquitin transferase n=1 Tax=Canavalia gladiata TaxID=3824 RepID=A0AAN9MVP5_CANGL